MIPIKVALMACVSVILPAVVLAQEQLIDLVGRLEDNWGNRFIYYFVLYCGTTSAHAMTKLRWAASDAFLSLNRSYITFLNIISGIAGLFAVGCFLLGFLIYPWWFPIIAYIAAGVMVALGRPYLLETLRSDSEIVLYSFLAALGLLVWWIVDVYP